MATLATIFGTTYAVAGGGSSKTPATPPINASSSDEADFIKFVPVLSWSLVATLSMF